MLTWALFVILITSANAHCFNSVKDFSETDIDCGGHECWTRCDIGGQCNHDIDCETLFCTRGYCQTYQSRVLPEATSGAFQNQTIPHVIILPYDDMNRAISIVALLCSFVAFILGCKMANMVCKRNPKQLYTLERRREIGLLQVNKDEEEEEEDNTEAVHV